MKSLINLLFILSIYSLGAQCDSMNYVVEGNFITNTSKNPVLKLTKGDWENPIGKIVQISKEFETELFGSAMTGWIGIAHAKVIKEDNDLLTLKIIDETSNIEPNGKKENQFEKGSYIKLEWRGKAFSEPHIEMNGLDTTIVGQFKCGERNGQWKWFFEKNIIERTAYYKNGVYEGEYQIYKEDGHLYEDGIYINGKIVV
jgi:hypothetical protein